eukprot:TRINITY_DN658_c1_g1_i2.p2 TRINITY_DN658_c1_g1~~TRINITY_DN658_c1_g1_i2.p2  ORF type:complete len:284 (-),score=-14.50 TRINITY_DN658_c1_g1_i2:558-1409(-)
MIIIFLKIGKIENNGIYVLLLKKLDIFLEYAGLFYFYFFNKFEQLDIPKGQNRVRLFCSIKQNYNFYNISVILIFEIISNNDYKQQRELIYQKIKNLKLKDIFFYKLYVNSVNCIFVSILYIFIQNRLLTFQNIVYKIFFILQSYDIFYIFYFIQIFNLFIVIIIIINVNPQKIFVDHSQIINYLYLIIFFQHLYMLVFFYDILQNIYARSYLFFIWIYLFQQLRSVYYNSFLNIQIFDFQVNYKINQVMNFNLFHYYLCQAHTKSVQVQYNFLKFSYNYNGL